MHQALSAHIAAIEAAARTTIGVDQLEPLLVDLLTLLKSPDLDRADGVTALTRLATEWPWGSVEILEFCLRDLRWTELRAVLERESLVNADFRSRDMATSVLEVFADDWPGGEIYETYR